MADKINIDVLTLDSVQCAACGYMMESIAALPSDVQDMIVYKEWSIKNKDGIGKFIELQGKVLPTICIEGELVFESREIYQGWDGYHNQMPAANDVYVWMADGKWKDGQSFSLHGDVTLVRGQYW